MLMYIQNSIRLIAMLATSAAMACCASGGLRSAASVDDIVHDQGVLAGTEVSVRGYLRFGDDARNLWADRDVYLRVAEGSRMSTDPLWNRCLTLYDVGAHRARLASLDGKEVVVTGRVRQVVPRPGDVTTSACNTIGIVVHAVR